VRGQRLRRAAARRERGRPRQPYFFALVVAGALDDEGEDDGEDERVVLNSLAALRRS